jgi:ATP-dependent Clp protease ATP-binding subunit ClpC
VVLFDEIEKAHPEAFNVLLQILEDGRLTDGQGRTVDFRNTVIIMTSNLGNEQFQRPALGFVPAAKPTQSEKDRQNAEVERALRQTFRPELLNRIDEIIVFDPLTEEDLKQIVDLLLNDVRARLAERNVGLNLTEPAKTQLVQEGYDPVYGARPLRRTIERRIANPLSRRILEGDFKEGDTAVVDYVDGEFVFGKEKPARKREKVAAKV